MTTDRKCVLVTFIYILFLRVYGVFVVVLLWSTTFKDHRSLSFLFVYLHARVEREQRKRGEGAKVVLVAAWGNIPESNERSLLSCFVYLFTM